MGELLFNPNGRIGRNRFWQGMVILTVASVLVAAGFRMVSVPLVFLHFVLIYPYICVVGKRLHDAGLTAWLSLLVWLGAMIVNQIVSGVLGRFMISPETLETYEKVMELLEQNEVDPAMEGMMIVLRDTVPLVVVTTILVGAIVALALGAIRPEPRENKHGPVPGSDPSGSFQ
ncbi:MAG: DUF805 domain-containing protein [Pseudomonadota bacterium]